MLLLAPCLSSPTHANMSHCPAVLTQVVCRAVQKADEGILALTLLAVAGLMLLFQFISDGLQVDLAVLDTICCPLEPALTLHFSYDFQQVLERLHPVLDAN